MNSFVKFVVDNFLGGLKGNVIFTRNERAVIDNFEITENGDETVFSAEVGCFEYFRIIAKANENSVIFSIDCKHAHGDFNNFQPENCINFNIGGGAEPEAIRYFYHRYTCCLEPEYCESSALSETAHTLRFSDTATRIIISSLFRGTSLSVHLTVRDIISALTLQATEVQREHSLQLQRQTIPLRL